MISVIIPVYNTEKYIRRCLDSLLSQNQKDFELILVDDGSTDQSGTICDEYASRDSRIKVFHKKNGGVSSARNIGLEKARGEWIAFVDADDYVDEDYLTIPELYESCDVVQKGYRRIYEIEKIITPITSRKEGIISKGLELKRFFVNHHTYALWNKLFKSSVIKGCEFNTDISVGEDFDYFLHFFHKIERYAFVNIGCYYYLDREGTSMELFRKNNNYRMKIEYDNLCHIKSLLTDDSDKDVLNGFVYGTYVPLFIKYYTFLDTLSKDLLDYYVRHLELKCMRLLNLKKKILLIIFILRYKFWVL